MEILENFVMPKRKGNGNKGSMYLTTEQEQVINTLTVGQAVIVPKLENVEQKTMGLGVSRAVNSYCRAEGTKKFAFANVENGVVVKLIKHDIAPTADAAPEEPTADAAE